MFAALAQAAQEAPSIALPSPTVPGLGVHIDGDYLAYYAAGPDDRTPGDARLKALELVESFKARAGADHAVMHNTARGCHKGERYLIAREQSYQVNRVDGRKPKNQPYLQEFLQTYEGPLFRAKNWTSREADDGIGACANHGIGTPHGYIAIATADKDMRMLPGLHIDWLSRKLVTVAPGAYDVIGAPNGDKPGKQYGLKWFWLQMLMGDDTDHIPGLKAYRVVNKDGTHKGTKPVGIKTAEKFLQGCTSSAEAFRVVIDLYRDAAYGMPAGHGDDRFCEQAALLWMRLDTKAAVGDFARHAGHSRINHQFDAPLWEAVKRLETRVQFARDEINSFGDSPGETSTDGATG